MRNRLVERLDRRGSRLQREVGRALEHVERLALAAARTQRGAPRAACVARVAPAPMLGKQVDAARVGAACAVEIAAEDERAAERAVRASLDAAVLAATDRKRFAGVRLGRGGVAE